MIAARVRTLENHLPLYPYDDILPTHRLHPDLINSLSVRYPVVFPNVQRVEWICAWTSQDIPPLTGGRLEDVVVNCLAVSNVEHWEGTVNFGHRTYPVRLADRVVDTLRQLGERCPNVRVEMGVDVPHEDVLELEERENVVGEIIAAVRRAVRIGKHLGWAETEQEVPSAHLLVLKHASGREAYVGCYSLFP